MELVHEFPEVNLGNAICLKAWVAIGCCCWCGCGLMSCATTLAVRFIMPNIHQNNQTNLTTIYKLTYKRKDYDYLKSRRLTKIINLDSYLQHK